MWDEVRQSARRRHDRLPDDALSRGGRRAGRPAGDHRPRSDRRRRHGRRAQAPGRRRRRHDRRRRRDRARPRSGAATAVRPRRDRRGRRRPPVRRPGGCGGPEPHPRPRRRRASSSPSIALHRPSLDDVFLRQTGRSLREEPRPDPAQADNPPRRTHDVKLHPRHLAHLPPIHRPDPAPAGVGVLRADAADPLPGPVRAAPRGGHRHCRAAAGARSTGSCPG